MAQCQFCYVVEPLSKGSFLQKDFVNKKNDNFFYENANEALIQLEVYVLKNAIVKL